MAKFLADDFWNRESWDTYLNNIDILRRRRKIKKSEFSKIIGVANAWRKDRNRAGRGEIHAICREFNVDEKWLSTDHVGQVRTKELLNDHRDIIVSEKSPEYKLHGDPPQFSLEDLTGIPPEAGMGRAFKMLMEIYESGKLTVIEKTVVLLEQLKEEAAADDSPLRDSQMWSALQNRIETIESQLQDLQAGIEKILSKTDREGQ